MKRVAESQLTKDSVENEDDSQEPTTGFQKADPISLSDRKIRGLPKRGSSAASPTVQAVPLIEPSIGTTNQSSESASRFSGFTGFGSANPSAFTFTPPTSHSSIKVPQPFQSPSVSTGKPFQLAPTSQPSKVFSFVPISNPTPPSTPPSSSEMQIKRDAAHKYWLSLRGLNRSFLDAMTQAVQTDPFMDITELLEKYKSLRSITQKTFDDGIAILDSDQTSTVVPTITPLSESARATSTQLHATGFMPKLSHARDEPHSPFTWPSKTESTSLSGAEKSEASTTPLRSTPLMSNSHDTGSTGFTPEMPTDGQNEVQRKDLASSPFSSKPSTAIPLTPGFSSFLTPSKPADGPEDSSTPQPHSKSSTSNPSPPSPSSFGFGTGKNSSTSKPLSFGKGSIGNPVGFAFGSPSTTPAELKPPGTDTNQETGLKGGAEVHDGASLSAPSHDPSPAPSQGSAYDADGPGEEDEVTLHEVKAHAFKMVATGDTKGWSSVGRGQLKLKGRDGTKRRLLMRNSNNGQVILNFNLFPGFQTKIEDKRNVISFRVPGDDESASVYHLRVRNEAEAVSCLERIQKEVDGLPRSDDT